MANVVISPSKVQGKIKPMHGVGQPPLMGIDTKYFSYLSDAHIPYSRLHDVGGWFGQNMWVDIPNIFRDFEKDATKAENYDFTWTDILIKGLMEHNCKPVYRLGVTIENFQHIKAYRIHPPKDMQKWAVICEHIIRHYNEGWADGFHFDIEYWEIWNEPDNGRPWLKTENMMWTGTEEDFYELYRVTSLHLRKCFGNSIKIGGYGHSGFYRVDDAEDIANTLAAGMALKEPATDWEGRTQYFIDFFDGFLDMVIKEKLPFDFFSHHSYANVECTVKRQIYAEKRLQEAGLDKVEIHLNEWNTNPNLEKRATLEAFANAASMMIAMQSTKMEMMCFYDARIGASVYGGMFNPFTYEPYHTYYGFKAFGELFELENQIALTCDDGEIYALGASDGKKVKVFIVNSSGKEKTVTLEGAVCKAIYEISEEKNLEKIENPKNTLILGAYEGVLAEF